MESLRVLIDPPAHGAWNMAVDEALLETAAATGLATLRFYQWREPTLSLGYFQAIADREQHAASRDCPLVRRASGGGAILHDRELTYSIALPQRAGRLGAATELCDDVHLTLIETLREFAVAASLYCDATSCRSGSDSIADGQPFLCFQRRTCSDIVYEGAKIVGSAQRRRRGAVLQHGSILLARSPFAPELPGIENLADLVIAPAVLASRWTMRLADRLAVSFHEGNLSADEQSRAKELVAARFAAAERLERR